MMTKEEYKREIVRMWDSLRTTNKGEHSCDGVNCKDCPLNPHLCKTTIDVFDVYDFVEVVEKWSKEHPPKKYKLSALENDIIFTVLDFGTGDEKFSNYKLLTKLLKDGYFEGAKPSDKIADYIENCEVADDD